MNRTPQTLTDAEDLKSFGYVQELLREMGGFSSFAVSFSVISILTGAIQLYGYGLQHGGPLQITAGWILVSVFTLTVALAMAELASAYPTAGALYHWSTFLGSRGFGWATACFNTIGQFAILAGIDYGLAQLLVGVLTLPSSRLLVALIYCAFLFSHAMLNHRGIRLVSWLNNFSAWYHIGVIVLLIGALSAKGFAQHPAFLLHFQNSSGYSPKYSFLVGLLLAQWTLTGYDASAHVTEETVDPRRNAPWGIFLATAISIVAGFLMLVVITLSIPDLSQAIGFGDNAFTEILRLRLGYGMGTAIVLLVLGAMWLCGLAAMTSASRMIYAFARDGGLPGSKYWAFISKKYRTPTHAIWGLAGFALALALSVNVYSAVVSVAVIALYISYGLPIAGRLYARYTRKQTDFTGPWSLGRFSTPVAIIAVIWITFICVVFVLPPNDLAGEVMLTGGVVLALLWGLLVRRKFAGPPASALNHLIQLAGKARETVS